MKITLNIDEGNFLLPEEHKIELNKRIENHKSGKSKSFTWEKIKEKARAANE